MRSEPLDCRAPQARPPSLDRVETGNAPREIRTGNRPVNRLRSTRPTLDRVAVFGEEDSSTTADKTMFVARSGRTHLRKFASRRKARRTTRPRYRSPSSTLTGMVGRASPCPGAAPPRSVISSRSRGDRHGQPCREAPHRLTRQLPWRERFPPDQPGSRRIPGRGPPSVEGACGDGSDRITSYGKNGV